MTLNTVPVTNAPVSSAILILKSFSIDVPENELDLSEIGLLATMVNEVDADYKDINGLSAFLGERATKVKDTAESLTSKGYLIKNNGVYAVNKFRIKDMLLVEQNM